MIKCAVNNCDRQSAFSTHLNRYIRECNEHRAERMERDMARRKRKSEQNQCACCSESRDGSSVYCAQHKKRHAERMKSRRNLNKDAGLCMECGNSVVGDAKRCPLHLSQQRDYVAKVERLPPEQRRHYASYCSLCGLYRVQDDVFCSICDTSRTQSTEFRWHEKLRSLANADNLWPPSSSTFVNKKAFGTLECPNEKLVYADMVWLLQDRVVVVECDEFGHADRPADCEVARMDNMQFGSDAHSVKPLVVLRFNPHELGEQVILRNWEQRLAEFYQDIRQHLTCDFSELPPLNQVKVIFYNYNVHSKHVEMARNNQRFIVVEK